MREDLLHGVVEFLPEVVFLILSHCQDHSAFRAPENVVPMRVLAVRVSRYHVRISFYCLYHFRRVVELAAEGMASLTVCSPIGCDLARTVFLFKKQYTLHVGEFCEQESRGGSYRTHSYDCDVVNISHQSSRAY